MTEQQKKVEEAGKDSCLEPSEEHRLYRHRCLDFWLLELCENKFPLSSVSKWVVMHYSSHGT